VLLWRLNEPRYRPRKTWKAVVDKNVNDLLMKLTDAMDHSDWRELVRHGATVTVVVMLNCMILVLADPG